MAHCSFLTKDDVRLGPSNKLLGKEKRENFNMETHLLAVGYSLIAMIIGVMTKKAYGIHKTKVERSKCIVDDIHKGIRKNLPNEMIQSNYALFNTFLSSMRHGYIVSLFLKLSIAAMAIVSIVLASFINAEYVYAAIAVVVILFSWLFYTDWMYAKEISSYEKALLEALASLTEE